MELNEHLMVFIYLFIFAQGIVALDKLQVLDVAGNRLSMFPVEVRHEK